MDTKKTECPSLSSLDSFFCRNFTNKVLKSRIVLRYLNRIVIQESQINLREYFTAPPALPNESSFTLGSFLTRLESNNDEEGIELALTFASTEASEGQSAFFLDLSAVWEQQLEEPLPLEEVKNILTQLKHKEKKIFEESITDKAREVFDAK